MGIGFIYFIFIITLDIDIFKYKNGEKDILGM